VLRAIQNPQKKYVNELTTTLLELIAQARVPFQRIHPHRAESEEMNRLTGWQRKGGEWNKTITV